MGGHSHMAATLAGCKAALVGTGWTVSYRFSTMGTETSCRGTIFVSVGSFQSGRVLVVEEL